MIPVPLCRFDGSGAVAVVDTPNGCIAFPDDRQQFLCWQHYGSLYDGTGGDYSTLMLLEGIPER